MTNIQETTWSKFTDPAAGDGFNMATAKDKKYIYPCRTVMSSWRIWARWWPVAQDKCEGDVRLSSVLLTDPRSPVPDGGSHAWDRDLTQGGYVHQTNGSTLRLAIVMVTHKEPSATSTMWHKIKIGIPSLGERVAFQCFFLHKRSRTCHLLKRVGLRVMVVGFLLVSFIK